MTDRPVFLLRLQPLPGVDAILRLALKVLLRRYGLRCISIEGQKESER